MPASENVRKSYDEKCNLLRRQFARGLIAQLIDKTRAVVKDLRDKMRLTNGPHEEGRKMKYETDKWVPPYSARRIAT